MKGLLPAKIVNELNLGAGKKRPLMMEITNGDSNNFLGREISKLEDNLKTELRESLRVESEGTITVQIANQHSQLLREVTSFRIHRIDIGPNC